MRPASLVTAMTALGLLLCQPLASGAQSVALAPNAESAVRAAPPHASSSGRGEVRVTADRAVLTAVIETRSDSAGAAASENTRKYGALMRAREAAGVHAQQISSPGYTVTAGPSGVPMFAVVSETSMPGVSGTIRPPARGPTALARRSIRVDMVRLEEVDRVVAAAAAAGATQIGAQFAAPSLASAQQQALMAAVADAQANADAMARGVGGTLGRLVDLNTSFSPYGGVTSYISTTAYDVSPFGGTLPPSVRDLTVVATVTGRWEIVMPSTRVP